MLNNLLSSHPLPNFGQICQERSNLGPPPPFQKKKAKLSLGTALRHLVHPNMWLQPKKVVGCSAFLSFHFTSVRIKYCHPTVDLGEVPIHSASNRTGPNLNSLLVSNTYYPLRHDLFLIFCTNQPIHVKWVSTPNWLHIMIVFSWPTWTNAHCLITSC